MVKLSEWQICHEICWSISAHGRTSHIGVHGLKQDGLCEEAEVTANGKRVSPATRFQALTAQIAYTSSAYHIPMHTMAIKLEGATI
jgi:hypothetical protein